MSIRKTSRKNKTKQTINWPMNDSYFTIDSLVNLNQHMLTSAGSDITLRVRLEKAREENLVSVIGQKSSGKGRPQKVYAMKPVTSEAIQSAKNNGISMDSPTTMTIVDISSNQSNVNPAMSSVQNIINQKINA